MSIHTIINARGEILVQPRIVFTYYSVKKLIEASASSRLVVSKKVQEHVLGV